MSLAQRAFKGFLWNHFGKIFEYALMYFFSLIVARALGPEDNGLYVTVVSLGQMILVLSALGFEEAINKFVPGLNLQNEKNKIRYLFRWAMAARWPATLFACLVVFVFRQEFIRFLGAPSKSADYLAVILLFVLLKGLVNLFIYLLYGRLQTMVLSIISVVARSIELLAAVIVLKAGLGITAIILVLVSGETISLLSYFVYQRNWIWGPTESWDLKPVIKFALTVWANAIINFLLFKHFGVIVLNYLLQDPAQVSYYDVAINIAMLINYALNIGMKGVTLAAYAEIIPRSRSQGAVLFNSVVKFKCLMLIPFFLFGGFYADPLIRFLYGSQYLPAIHLFQMIALISVVGSIMGGGSNPEVLFALDKERLVIGFGVVGIVINLALYFLLIPRLSSLGAIIATYVGNMSSIALMYLVVHQHLQIKIPFRFWLKITLSFLAAIGLISLLPLQAISLPLLVELVLRFGLFSGLGLVGLWLTKPLHPEDKKILDKVNPRLSDWLSRFLMRRELSGKE